MSYATLVTEDLRLSLLQALAEDPDYAINEHILGRALELVGHAVGADRVRTELYWLAEQGLIGLETVGSLSIAKLSGRGLDVARGLSRVPGVARPRPG